jgi:two-component system, chemotaxis family, protein-glutamate methylesterase/glutaminase
MRQIDAVVIGASAGGVEGLSVLLPTLSATLQVSIFIVMHLPREQRSLLSEIFAPKCALRVSEAEDKAPVAPGCVYFAPPDYHLLLDEGPSMALSVDEPVHFSRPSIDVLFESASDLYRQRLLGIILTGASQDGADGLAAVRSAGGITVVQQPDGSYESHMATAALKLGPVDYVLPLDGIAGLTRSLPTIDLR